MANFTPQQAIIGAALGAECLAHELYIAPRQGARSSG
jgi:hypothetical protein